MLKIEKKPTFLNHIYFTDNMKREIAIHKTKRVIKGTRKNLKNQIQRQRLDKENTHTSNQKGKPVIK